MPKSNRVQEDNAMNSGRATIDRAARLSRRHRLLTWEQIAALQRTDTSDWEDEAAGRVLGRINAAREGAAKPNVAEAV